MMENTPTPIVSRDPDALALRLRTLVGLERNVQTDFLLCLSKFDRVRGYERFGHANLWDFCRKELGLLECATFRRTHAVALLQRHPQAEAYLRDGRLWMTTFVMLEKLLNLPGADANELFEAASGKITKEVAYFVACRMPVAVEPPTHVRQLPAPRVVEQTVAVEVTDASASASAETSTSLFAEPPPMRSAVAVVAPRPPKVAPLSADRFVVQVTVDKSFVDLLAEAKIALSHRVPSGDLEAVLRAALEDVVAREAKRNAPPPPKKEVDRSAPSPQLPPVGRWSLTKRAAIPAAVRREVWQRDGGCCVWKGANGRICGSRWQLELDHIVACARGGASTVANLRLLCALCRARHKRHYSARRIMPRSSRRATVVTVSYAA